VRQRGSDDRVSPVDAGNLAGITRRSRWFAAIRTSRALWEARGGTEKVSQAARTARSAKTREGTKRALLIDMLKRTEGATIDEIVAATGWQPHTVRGAFAGALKKRLGLTIKSEKVEGRGRVYRVDS
jgi:hypothetical protein